MRARVPVLVVAALVLCLGAGCAGRGPKTRFYALDAPPGADSGTLATRPELGLLVGPIEFPRYLDRPQIVTRDGSHRLILANAHRWAGSLRNDVLRFLADEIGRLLGTSRVAQYPNEPGFAIDYRVVVDLLEFEGIRGGDVSLHARWALATGTEGRAVVVEESRIAQPTASTSFEDLVAAHGAALARLSREIAARLAELPPAGPSPRPRATGAK